MRTVRNTFPATPIISSGRKRNGSYSRIRSFLTSGGAVVQSAGRSSAARRIIGLPFALAGRSYVDAGHARSRPSGMSYHDERIGGGDRKNPNRNAGHLQFLSKPGLAREVAVLDRSNQQRPPRK